MRSLISLEIEACENVEDDTARLKLKRFDNKSLRVVYEGNYRYSYWLDGTTRSIERTRAEALRIIEAEK